MANTELCSVYKKKEVYDFLVLQVWSIEVTFNQGITVRIPLCHREVRNRYSCSTSQA